MNNERIEYLVNEMYYNYLEINEAQELVDHINDLHQRITKAIEYIDRRDIEWGSDEHDKLLEILRGEKWKH